MLGENTIRFLDLDRTKQAEIAGRVGPTVEDITGPETLVDLRLIRQFHDRGGYSSLLRA
jgi:hypothetical protein